MSQLFWNGVFSFVQLWLVASKLYSHSDDCNCLILQHCLWKQSSLCLPTHHFLSSFLSFPPFLPLHLWFTANLGSGPLYTDFLNSLAKYQCRLLHRWTRFGKHTQSGKHMHAHIHRGQFWKVLKHCCFDAIKTGCCPSALLACIKVLQRTFAGAKSKRMLK